MLWYHHKVTYSGKTCAGTQSDAARTAIFSEMEHRLFFNSFFGMIIKKYNRWDTSSNNKESTRKSNAEGI